jgi:hypothetical protein
VRLLFNLNYYEKDSIELIGKKDLMMFVSFITQTILMLGTPVNSKWPIASESLVLLRVNISSGNFMI